MLNTLVLALADSGESFSGYNRYPAPFHHDKINPTQTTVKLFHRLTQLSVLLLRLP